MPTQITEIYTQTFAGCSIKEIYISETIEYIEAYAFNAVNIHFKGNRISKKTNLPIILDENFNIKGKYHFNCKH